MFSEVPSVSSAVITSADLTEKAQPTPVERPIPCAEAGWPRTTQERLGVLGFGLVGGFDMIGYSVALASLLFTGALSPGLGMATGSSLLCTAIVAIFVGFRSRVPSNIGQVQDVAVAVLATSFAQSNISVATAFVIVALSSFAAGVVLWLTGRFKLGRVVKYFPQAVLAGFLAGTGWLLVKGGVTVAMGYTPTLASLGDTSGQSIRRLIPAIVIAFVIYFRVQRFRHPMILLSLLGLSLVGFYAWMTLSGTSHVSAISSGFLPPTTSGPAGGLPFPRLLSEANWGDVGSATPTIFTVAMLCLFAMLMNTAALEAATGKDVNIDLELKDTGLGNVLVAAIGGPPGYSGLSLSILGDKSGVRHRGAGIVTAAIVLLGFAFANQIVSRVPTFLRAGFVIFLGIDLLADWLVNSFRRFSRTEIATVVLILGFVVFSGFLQATIAGFVVATLLFAYSYARVPIVRSIASVATVSSTRERPSVEAEYLREKGTSIDVLRLHGYLFFGSTERIVRHVTDRLASEALPPLRALLLDATLVTGLDAASAAALERVRVLGSIHGFNVLLSGASPAVLSVLQRCEIPTTDSFASAGAASVGTASVGTGSVGTGTVGIGTVGIGTVGIGSAGAGSVGTGRSTVGGSSAGALGSGNSGLGSATSVRSRRNDPNAGTTGTTGSTGAGTAGRAGRAGNSGAKGSEAIMVFDHVDLALQYAENWLLSDSSDPVDLGLRLKLCGDDVGESDFAALTKQMHRSTHKQGEVILHTGDIADELLVLESGSVAVVRISTGGSYERLREMGDGAVIGDIGFILGQRRSADVIALEPSVILRISRAEVAALEQTHPRLATLLFRIVSQALAQKVLIANRMTDQLK
jgi:sulfate permease, SulP family